MSNIPMTIKEIKDLIAASLEDSIFQLGDVQPCDEEWADIRKSQLKEVADNLDKFINIPSCRANAGEVWLANAGEVWFLRMPNGRYIERKITSVESNLIDGEMMFTLRWNMGSIMVLPDTLVCQNIGKRMDPKETGSGSSSSFEKLLQG